MSLMSTLNMSTNAMGVHQNVISIVSNNISNMNTEGYHKQKANLGTLVLGIPINNSVNTQVKTSAGVEMINVERYTTTFIGSYYRDQLTNQSYLNQKADGMQDIANMFDELSGRGLDTALADFYKALDKTGPRTAWKYFPRFNPEDTMIFDLAKVAVDDYTIKPQVTFMLNGEHLPLDNDNILPMFSFLGKALKFIENHATQSDTKKAAKDMNSIMHKEVMNYIG